MGEHGHVGTTLPDLALEALEQLVSALHGPCPGHQHVQRDEPPCARLPRAQGVVLHVVGQMPFDGAANGIALVDGQRRVEQPEHRRRARCAAGPDDVRGHQQGDDRVEALPSRDDDGSDAATTPADVHTSVSRWCALAASVTDSKRRLARRSTRATTRFTSEAVTDTARPSSELLEGPRRQQRPTAAVAMLSAATRIRLPSTPLEKYSALLCPYACSSSGSRAATVSIHSAISAPTRLTSDSTASESRPTDP